MIRAYTSRSTGIVTAVIKGTTLDVMHEFEDIVSIIIDDSRISADLLIEIINDIKRENKND